MKNSERKYHRVCIFLNDVEKDKLYLAVYKEKTSPAKIFRKALMSYVDKILSDGVSVVDVKEDDEPIIL